MAVHGRPPGVPGKYLWCICRDAEGGGAAVLILTAEVGIRNAASRPRFVGLLLWRLCSGDVRNHRMAPAIKFRVHAYVTYAHQKRARSSMGLSRGAIACFPITLRGCVNAQRVALCRHWWELNVKCFPKRTACSASRVDSSHHGRNY